MCEEENYQQKMRLLGLSLEGNKNLTLALALIQNEARDMGYSSMMITKTKLSINGGNHNQPAYVIRHNRTQSG